ncbi:HK97 gp10 family phage protein [Clostridium sp. Cult1]|uniref:HK97 gp10 family phage protein n=1 Tax=Clostridium sp. Cult1 TaxID=2079002 RepID=UPI001F2CFC31|nr:HK97 gp10 family phage protein [Clostridium sp. Cult1]MCF6464200.1 hypothetical protein [Clostridium sp. Cult1]
MSLIGIWDTKELKEWIDKLKGLSDEKIQKFNEDTVKQIAAMTLAKIITNTPVGDYPKGSGEIGGTLRRGWTTGKIDVPKDEECNIADAFVYIANDIDVIKKGRTYIIILSNPVNYASYVEYGHRTREKKDGTRGWVDGQFFMKISEDEMQDELPALLEEKLNDFLGEYFK